MQHGRWLLIIWTGWLASCATQTKSGGSGSHDEKTNAAQEDGAKKDSTADDDLYVSTNLATLTYSLSNNSLSSRTINLAKAKELASDLEGKLGNPSGKDRRDMMALMAAKRLSGEGVGPVFQTAKKLMVVEMKEDIRREMPEVAQLELALASIHSRQFPMAEHWLGKLQSSKNEKTRAAAYTARGIVAMIDGRLPEAIALWNEALAQRKDYEPARLNIGFSALRFGDYKTAKAMLAGISEDWFVQTAHVQIERLADNPKEAAQLCASLLEKKKNYKPAAFSCALNEYQGLGNLAKARQALEELAKTDGGPSTIDEKAYLTIGKIEKEQREQQLKDKAAAAAAAPKPAQSGTAPAAGTGNNQVAPNSQAKPANPPSAGSPGK